MRRALAASLWLLLSWLPREASAEPTSEHIAAADAAFEEGKRLASQGDHEAACSAFEKSQQLAPASGTLLNLGDCYERLGRTATAWAMFRASAAAARNSKKGAARTKEALARAAALEPRLVKLRVVVPPEVRVPDLSIQRDGVPLEASMWDVAVPVDPGPHRVRVEAPGHEVFEHAARVPTTGVVELIVPRLSRLDEQPTVRPASNGGVQPIFGLVLGAIGLAAIGVGLGVGIDAILVNARSNEAGCRDGLCPADALALRDRALTEAHVSTGITSAGLAHVAAGLILVITAPSGDAQVGPDVGMLEDGVFVGVRGRW
jgi:serine/threonine-protein kinase